MITVNCFGTIKAEAEVEWPAVLRWLVETTHAEDEGCLGYSWYGPVPNANEFKSAGHRDYLLFEQWRDEVALSAHVSRLQQRFGPPPPGGALPARFLDYFERFEAVFYDVRTRYVMVGVAEPEISS